MSENKKHTPLPWTVGALNPMTGQIRISYKYYNSEFTSTGGIGSQPIADIINKEVRANAEFIVCACNSHYQLLGTLKQVDEFFTALGKYTRDYPGSDWTHQLVKDTISKAEAK